MRSEHITDLQFVYYPEALTTSFKRHLFLYVILVIISLFDAIITIIGHHMTAHIHIIHIVDVEIIVSLPIGIIVSSFYPLIFASSRSKITDYESQLE